MEGGDEIEPVSFGVAWHGRLYQEIGGIDEGDGSEGLERVKEGLFHVYQLVFIKESSGGSFLHLC